MTSRTTKNRVVADRRVRSERPALPHDAALIAVGANLGDPVATCTDLLDVLGAWGTVVARSSLYLTEPVGGPGGQPPYVNGVVAFVPPASDLEPVRLLDGLHAVERAFGRTRNVRWEARTLDLDLIDVGGRIVESSTLVLPHPRVMERPFVLIPLRDVAPTWVHPVTGSSIDEALRRWTGDGVQRLNVDGWPG